MAHTVQEFDPAMASRAAAIFVKGFAALRRDVPQLPSLLADRETVAKRLTALADKHPAVAAVDGARLLGFMSGARVAQFKGPEDGYFVPEWAHGVDQTLPASERAAIYHELYATASAAWMERSAPTHGISLLESDLLPLETLVWNGFGIAVVDAVRGTGPVAGRDDKRAGGAPAAAAAEITVAGAEDLDALSRMDAALTEELAAPPVFRLAPPDEGGDHLARRLADGTVRCWIARVDGKPAAYVAAEPAVTDCADIVQAPDTLSVVGAYVVPALRRAGLATALLKELVVRAKEEGYPRVAVDFESQNAPARAFWLKHFTPVARALVRTADARLARP